MNNLRRVNLRLIGDNIDWNIDNKRERCSIIENKFIKQLCRGVFKSGNINIDEPIILKNRGKVGIIINYNGIKTNINYNWLRYISKLINIILNKEVNITFCKLRNWDEILSNPMIILNIISDKLTMSRKSSVSNTIRYILNNLKLSNTKIDPYTNNISSRLHIQENLNKMQEKRLQDIGRNKGISIEIKGVLTKEKKTKINLIKGRINKQTLDHLLREKRSIIRSKTGSWGIRAIIN